MMLFADSQKGRKEKQNSAKETDSEEETSFWAFFVRTFVQGGMATK